MSRGGAADRSIVPFAILGVAYATLIVYAYPGYSSPDTALQLSQARAHVYSDGHPPAMAAMWGLIEHVIKGPLGMLLVQSLTLLSGLAMIMRRHFRPIGAAIAASVVFLFPPILAPMGVIWKDSQMAGFLVLGIGLLPRHRWLALVSLTLATAMRHNGLVAAFPVFMLLWPHRDARRWFVRLAVGFALWLASTATALGTNRLLTSQHENPWSYSVGPADIVGTLANAHTPHSDEELLPLLEGTPLVVKHDIQAYAHRVYAPLLWWWVVNGDNRVFDFPANQAQCDAIRRAWLAIVKLEPGPYLHHRMRVFRAVVGYGTIFNPMLWAPVWHSYQIEVDDRPSAPQVALQDLLDWTAVHTPLFRPYIYLLFALIFLPLTWRRKEVTALFVSGVLYEVTLIPFVPSAEFRYSHWLIASVTIGVVILVRERITAAAASVRRSG